VPALVELDAAIQVVEAVDTTVVMKELVLYLVAMALMFERGRMMLQHPTVLERRVAARGRIVVVDAVEDTAAETRLVVVSAEKLGLGLG
jgi:hypothetical protein